MANSETQRLTFVRLAERTDAVPLVAKWWFEEWGHERPGSSVAALADDIRSKLSPDDLPIQVLAVRQNAVVGVAVLKLHEMKDVFPERKHWLGSLFVPPEHRGHGIGGALIRAIEDIAVNRGLRLLHLQTERLDGGLYARLGWTPREKIAYRTYEALVMIKSLENESPRQ